MKRILTLCVVVVCMAWLAVAQSGSNPSMATVPQVMKFNGVAKDDAGKPLHGVVGITFALYQEEEGGAPLWMETQNVHADARGRYEILIGAEKSLPVGLFHSGDARWLGVQVTGEKEQSRILLMSVPYALKAADAETLGGKPASAFLQVPSSRNDAGSDAVQKLPPTVHGNGTINFIPLWTAKNIIDKSALFQSGANVGVGTTAPTALLDVAGTSNIRNTLTLFPNGTAPTMSISGTAFSVSNTGFVTFVAGQTFPGKGGSGTVTSVGLSAPSSDFSVSGSPVTTSGTLGLNWTVAPTSGITANAIVKRDATGSFNVNNIAGTGTFSTSTVNNFGISVVASSANAVGILGHTISTSGSTIAVEGISDGLGAGGGVAGVYGLASNSDPGAGLAQGVTGQSFSPAGVGVLGLGSGESNTFLGVDAGPKGVWGDTRSNGIGVLGTADNGVAIEAFNSSPNLSTVFVSNGTTGGPVLQTFTANGNNCIIDGSANLHCTGTVTGSVKQFRIDHPLDPANKYLLHASIESPEMKNVYDGVATLDSNGEALVKMPSYFEALNGDFRYQLTCIGGFAPVYVAQEIANNQFRIAGGKAGLKVSWQVTGVRHDAWAKTHPMTVEEEKTGDERGLYLHPEAFGQPVEKSIGRMEAARQRAPRSVADRKPADH